MILDTEDSLHTPEPGKIDQGKLFKNFVDQQVNEADPYPGANSP